MGERGKNEEMKNRNTNLEAVEPASDKAETPDSMGKHPQKPEVRLGREAQARIGQILRDMYNGYVKQGVPSEMADLVRRLTEQE
jgi:hypothetical protein